MEICCCVYFLQRARVTRRAKDDTKNLLPPDFFKFLLTPFKFFFLANCVYIRRMVCSFVVLTFFFTKRICIHFYACAYLVGTLYVRPKRTPLCEVIHCCSTAKLIWKYSLGLKPTTIIWSIKTMKITRIASLIWNSKLMLKYLQTSWPENYKN